jgi:hypothetical protein
MAATAVASESRVTATPRPSGGSLGSCDFCRVYTALMVCLGGLRALWQWLQAQSEARP